MQVAGGLIALLEYGSMTSLGSSDYDAAVRIVTDDPTVKSGMLNVEVKTLWVPFNR